MMLYFRPLFTIYFYLLCSSAPNFKDVNAMGVCEFEEMLAKRLSNLTSGKTEIETRPTTTTTEYRTTTDNPTTTESCTSEQETTTDKIQSTTNVLSSTVEPVSTERFTTADKSLTTTIPPPTTDSHTTEQKTTTEQFKSNTYVSTIIEGISTVRQTTSEKLQTTTPIHTTRLTTSVTTTENWSTKITTAELSTFLSTTSPSCPTNMIYMNCTCQATCADPNGCYNSCDMDEEACLCPGGFYLMGGDCVSPEECGCYVQEEDKIMQEGDQLLVLNCTKSCSCGSGVLSCAEYQCDENAECKNGSDSRFQCTCLDGYHGNGLSCTRLTDCKDVYDLGLVDHGVYTILPTNWPFEAFNVYCKEGWTVFQRREDGSVDFNRYWTDYKGGFGNLDGEFWLGLEQLHYLTNQGNYKLYIYLIRAGIEYEINHSWFQIDNEGNNYALKELGSYSGNIGSNLMTVSHSYQFSTRDRDNDNHPDVDCSGNFHGGWWFKQCYKIYLNGPYGNPDEPGMCYIVNTNRYCNVQFTEMSIKP